MLIVDWLKHKKRCYKHLFFSLDNAFQMHTRLIILTNELFIFFTHGFCDSSWLYQCQTFNLYHALIKVKTFWVNVIILPSIFLLNKKTVRGHVFMFLCGFFNWQYVYNTKEPPYTIVGFKHVYKSSTRKKHSFLHKPSICCSHVSINVIITMKT